MSDTYKKAYTKADHSTTHNEDDGGPPMIRMAESVRKRGLVRAWRIVRSSTGLDPNAKKSAPENAPTNGLQQRGPILTKGKKKEIQQQDDFRRPVRHHVPSQWVPLAEPKGTSEAPATILDFSSPFPPRLLLPVACGAVRRASPAALFAYGGAYQGDHERSIAPHCRNYPDEWSGKRVVIRTASHK